MLGLPFRKNLDIKKISRIDQQQNAMNKGIITNLDTVLDNCRLSISELTSKLATEEFPKNVVMGIAGEYIQGVSIIVNYQREENFDKEVTPKEQAKSKIETNGKEDLGQRTGLRNEDIDILHITPTGLEIGGMPVDSLVGYKGREVKLHFYASFAPKTYTEALRKVAQELNLEVTGIVSQPFSVARAFSGSSNRDFSAIFIDIGGGTTDIAVVDRGNVVETKMFAFGGRTFTKEIAKVLEIDFRHAEQRKIKYSEKELTRELSNTIQKIVYPVSKLWMKTLKTALASCDDIDSFPPQIYLCGGGSLLPEIKGAMLEFPWKKFLPFTVVPRIEFFKPDRLDKIVDNSGELKHVFDITPASLTKFAYDLEISKNRNIKI
ncbi:MAG: cell division protein (septum formation) [candidate division WS6 bacterium GW2011_GWF1_35_23]|uniref:Cell division protein (Septum formation) n=1 Tax=candidate division WS6 bacterium GW2011_GWF1_35_23 TaxID=1619097 RepID=A0A0G0C2U2_9BACT|nr:MAG: cell division protein (septum formation) [candidate division WS6 bacterium GW2011_GWF1_35_23]